MNNEQLRQTGEKPKHPLEEIREIIDQCREDLGRLIEDSQKGRYIVPDRSQPSSGGPNSGKTIRRSPRRKPNSDAPTDNSGPKQN